MSRKEAEQLLKKCGDFLVRKSTTNPGSYVLTGLHNGQAKHLLLVDPEGTVSTDSSVIQEVSDNTFSLNVFNLIYSFLTTDHTTASYLWYAITSLILSLVPSRNPVHDFCTLQGTLGTWFPNKVKLRPLQYSLSQKCSLATSLAFLLGSSHWLCKFSPHANISPGLMYRGLYWGAGVNLLHLFAAQEHPWLIKGPSNSRMKRARELQFSLSAWSLFWGGLVSSETILGSW